MGTTMLTTKHLMTENPLTIRSDAKVRDAVRLVETLSVRHLPVVDNDGRLVGMISDRDLRGVTAPQLMGSEHAADLRAALEASVSTIMSTNVVTVGENATLRDVVGSMLENKIGALPVVNRSGSVVGIVSYLDVLRQLPIYDD
jgi:acetoin utilization protein AcuB